LWWILLLKKSIGFAGCSFTDGHGLEYYDGTNTVSRFSALVGSHFNINSINQSFRGGSHTKIISWWDSYLQQNNLDVFVFQLTRWIRSDSTVIPGVSHIDVIQHHLPILEKNNFTLDEYIEEAKKQDTLLVLNFLQKYENRFPIYILQWPEDTLSEVKQHNWMKERLLLLEYENENFECIADLMDRPLKRIKSKRPELTIATDYVNFKKPRMDYHPSKLCHKVIADNVIRRLENDNIFKNQ
jgi:hypothetical protein